MMKKDKMSEKDYDILEDQLNELDRDVDYMPRIYINNDEFNTFHHVISCLMRYCNHTEIQAEQLSLIIHTKGSAQVKHGTMAELTPIKEALVVNNLHAYIIEEG